MTKPAAARSLSLVIAIVIAALAVAHVRILAGGATWRDVTYHTRVAPPRLAAADAILSGRAPAWWDGTSLGAPLAAEPSHGALAPPLWIAGTPRALDLVMLGYLAFLAIGVALWARARAGASELAAAIAGALVGTSGLFVATALRGALPALAWLPWVALCATRLAAEPTTHRTRWACGLGACLGMIGAAGQLGVLVDGIAIAIVIGGTRATRRPLAFALVTGLAIACIQWLPAIAALGTTAGGQVHGFSIARLAELIAPAVAHETGADYGSIFVGVPLIALGLVAPSSRRRAGLAIAFAILAFVVGRGGWPAIAGAPETHLAALAIVLAAQCAAGVDALLAGERRAVVALGAGLAISAVAVGAIAMRDRASAATAMGVTACVALAIVAALAALTDPKTRPTWVRAVVAVLLVAPTASALPLVAPTAPRDVVTEPPRWAQQAIARAPKTAPIRVYRPALLAAPAKHAEEVEPSFDDQLATLAGEFGDRFGLAAARSDDPARNPLDDAAWLGSAFEGGALLDRLGIEFPILPTTIVIPRRMTALGERGTWTLVQLPVAPPASVVRGASFSRDATEALGILYPPGGGTGLPRGTIMITGSGDTRVDATEPHPCAIAAWVPGDIALTCTSTAPASYAAVSSSAAPGWDVTVDGEPAAVLTADITRRATPLPQPGVHAVHWHYRAPLLLPGALVAIAGLLALAGVLLTSRRPRP